MTIKLPSSGGGFGAIFYSLKMANRAGGLWPMLRALFRKNTCKTCALGMGGQKGGLRDEKGHFPSVCNKSFQAQAADMQGAVPEDFFERHTVEELRGWSSRQLERAGRLTRPMLLKEGAEHYQPVSWEEAFDLAAGRLRDTEAERAFFYASGRSSNEAGFLLQLFARVYGTNNVNNCSYYCHQASGVGLGASLGTGTATVSLDDLDAADLVFLVGANPASNHPRFMRVLMQVRRRGGRVIVVNPARERGLENFSVPSDPFSLLMGSPIASTYLQPHIGGDIALFKGIAKALLESEETAIDQRFIENHTEGFEAYQANLKRTTWQTLEKSSGISQREMEQVAHQYARSNNAVFAWAMGVTHHAHGVGNVQSLVNLALLRGMVGRECAGLLPLRGHSNVQGIGSVGFTPALRKAVVDNLALRLNLKVPATDGLDTLACMEAMHEGRFDAAWNLGGNLYGSNPDSTFAEEAFRNIGFVLYMNTTLNQGHFHGTGQTTLLLPVLPRDEEPEPTTQESMFNYVRLSEGGPARHLGPRSEVQIIAEIASRALTDSPVDWLKLRHPAPIRKWIGEVVPGFGKIKAIDETREEFHIEGRLIHRPEFPTESGRAAFTVCPLPRHPVGNAAKLKFQLMTVRSEGQFNTVVYESEDRYRGVKHRNVVLMNSEDMEAAGIALGARVTVSSATGALENQRVQPFPIKAGNIMMYYPEANVLVPRRMDPKSKTPSFKSVSVTLSLSG
jgi:molybdopterin-dependent oxidoreductase alpha subunit